MKESAKAMTTTAIRARFFRSLHLAFHILHYLLIKKKNMWIIKRICISVHYMIVVDDKGMQPTLAPASSSPSKRACCRHEGAANGSEGDHLLLFTENEKDGECCNNRAWSYSKGELFAMANFVWGKLQISLLNL